MSEKSSSDTAPDPADAHPPKSMSIEIVIPAAVFARLKELAEELGVPMPKLIGEAIETQSYLVKAARSGKRIILKSPKRGRSRELHLREQ